MSVSIVICSLNREESLTRLVQSLHNQTCNDFQLLIYKRPDDLVFLKEQGLREATGEVVAFLDDDVVCSPGWLEGIKKTFQKYPNVVGVTGPTYVPDIYMGNRDIMKDKWVNKLYNWYFLNNAQGVPGLLMPWGATSLGANYPSEESRKVWKVGFLEPSNYALSRYCAKLVGGFDVGFEGVSEWHELDLFHRMKQYGGLYYHPEIKVQHCPERGSTFNKRLNTAPRYRNFCRYAKNCLKPSFKLEMYKLFLRVYFYGKQKRMY